MPEIILPAGASICAFALAICTWYGALRNGVQLVYNDIQAARSFDRDVVAMAEELLRQKRAIEDWKMEWLILEDIPDSMYLEFWGEVEYCGIQAKLNNMVINCNLAEKKLKKFTKLEKDRWTNMLKAGKRLRFISMRKDHIQKLMDSIVKDIEGIRSSAKAGWLRNEYRRKDTVDSKHVYHAGIIHLIIPIAMRTRDDANALHRSCEAVQGNASLDLDLDIFDQWSSVLATQAGLLAPSAVASRETCAAGIAKAAKEGRLGWKILGQNSATGNLESVRMQVEKAELPSSGCPVASVAVTLVMQGNAERSHFTSSGTCFSIAMAAIPNQSSSEPRQTLRHILSAVSPPSFADENLLGEVSKFRVAFELAQACLLLLRTSWFPDICSCQIRCARSSSASSQFMYNFGLRMGVVDHEAPRWGTTIMDNCWGFAEENSWNFLTRPLRRFGLLLVEIILGTPILCITSNRQGIIETITFVEGRPPDLARRSETLDQVLNRVYTAFGRKQAARKAVRYCLSTVYPEASMDDDMKTLLAELYSDVVAP